MIVCVREVIHIPWTEGRGQRGTGPNAATCLHLICTRRREGMAVQLSIFACSLAVPDAAFKESFGHYLTPALTSRPSTPTPITMQH